jgi:hypothetical protein
MSFGAVISSVFGGLMALNLLQMVVSNIWLRGLLSLVAVVLVYRVSLLISDRYGNGAGMRFIRFLTRADLYEASRPQKEVPLTLSRAGLPEPDLTEEEEEDERAWREGLSLSR